MATMTIGKVLVLNLWDIRNPQAGGLEVKLHELSRRLANDGVQVDFLCSRFKGAKAREKIDDVNIIRVRGGRYAFFISAFWHYMRSLRERSPEKSGYDPPGNDSPGYDLIIEDIDKMPFFTPLYARGRTRHVLVNCSTLNHELYRQEMLFPFYLLGYAMEMMIPIIYRNNRFMVASKSTAQDLLRLGFSKAQLNIVRDGIDTSEFGPIPFRKKKTNQLLILSRLKKYKGIHHVIGALKLVCQKSPETRLVIAGRGDYEHRIRRLISRNGLERNITLAGHVSGKRKLRLIQESTILVSGSMKEGFGVAFLEANACGTPVIATDVPGSRDAVLPGKTGLLVPYGDEQAMADAILGLLGNARQRQMMYKASLRYAKEFDWADIYKDFKKLIDSLQ